MTHTASTAARRSRMPLLLATVAVVLSACASVPNLGPRAVAKPPEAYQTAQSFAAPTADWPADRWWDAYNDPALTGLIDEALAGSPTLAQARARLRAADAQAQQSRAATLPSLALNGQVAEAEQSREQGFPAFIQSQLPQGYQDTGRISLDASYDLDLFGKNRAALAAAVSETEAARADAAQARLTLSTGVAQAYADLVRLTAERAAAVDALKVKTQSAQLVADRVRNGLDTQGELHQAQAAAPASQAQVDALDEQILLTRHRIGALLGAGPDRALSLTAAAPAALKPFGLPGNLAVNLLGRRPDIVAARLRTEAAGKRIDVAHAGFYPNVTLNAFIGQQSLGLGQLFNPAAAIGSFGPAVSLPIFQGGRLRGAYRAANANYDAAVAAYDQTVTQALQDVADAAASVQAQQRQLQDRRQALAAGEAAYSIARLRYQGGLSSYVAVLSAEDAVIAQRRDLADAQSRAFVLDIALVRALGGGFTAS